jgi:hypothetical protein
VPATDAERDKVVEQTEAMHWLGLTLDVRPGSDWVANDIESVLSPGHPLLPVTVRVELPENGTELEKLEGLAARVR